MMDVRKVEMMDAMMVEMKVLYLAVMMVAKKVEI
jgi:hypothetical protein